MDVQRWERVKELFEAALERDEPERSPFLDEACSTDTELRREVDSLLSGEKNAGDFLQVPVAHLASPAPDGDNPPSTFSPDQVISGRFKVLRFIGRGGMGEVYEARDLERNVRVALKTVRPEIASNPKTMARFNKEVDLALTVTHHNVCRVYHLERHRPSKDSGKPEVVFLTMELLEGETLADRLRRQGKMSCAEALPLIRQMAEGLAAAHKERVVHCDFKPGNVMLVSERPADVDSIQSTQSIELKRDLTPDQAKAAVKGPPAGASAGASATVRAVITDFGLARAMRPMITRETIQESLDTGNHLVGTLPYMAPEQLEGHPATPASDVYAFGLVAYEMVTGRQPFSGVTPLSAIYKRLQAVPPRPRTLAPGLDRGLESIILRCLEKEPDARYANAGDVAGVLLSSLSPGAWRNPEDGVEERTRRVRRRVLASALAGFVWLAVAAATLRHFNPLFWQRVFGPPLPERKILTVLPFEAVDGRADEQVRCKGFTDTVTAKLAMLDSVEVPAAAVVRERMVTSIAKARSQLGATMVLLASWEQEGSSVRINLSLVDAKTGSQLRTDSVTGAADGGFRLQDEVVIAATEMLQLQLSPDNRQGLTAHGTALPSAYDFYVQGLGYLQGYQKLGNLDLATDLFQRAISEDGHYAQAQATLSLAYWYKYNATRDEQWAEKAKAAVNAAAKLDSGLSEVQLAIGDESLRTGDYQGAIAAFQRSVDLDPRGAEGYEGLGRAFESLGLVREADRAFQTAVQVRPSCWDCYNALGTFLFNQARFDGALQAWQSLIALAPDNAWGYMNVADVHLIRADFDKAGNYFRRALELDPDNADVYTDLGTSSYYLRRYDDEVRYCQHAVTLLPKMSEYWGNLGDAYRMIRADSGQAREAYRQAVRLAEGQLAINSTNSHLLGLMALYQVFLGEDTEARKNIAKALSLDPSDYNLLYNACLIHLHLGEQNDALRWLQRAVAAGYPRKLLDADPQLDSLRSAPEFEQLGKEARENP